METVEILHIEKEVLTVSREIWYNVERAEPGVWKTGFHACMRSRFPRHLASEANSKMRSIFEFLPEEWRSI